MMLDEQSTVPADIYVLDIETSPTGRLFTQPPEPGFLTRTFTIEKREESPDVHKLLDMDYSWIEERVLHNFRQLYSEPLRAGDFYDWGYIRPKGDRLCIREIDPSIKTKHDSGYKHHHKLSGPTGHPLRNKAKAKAQKLAKKKNRK